MARKSELEDARAPQTTQSVTTYAKSEKNEYYGRRLWFRVEVEGITQAEAWKQVFPASTANPRAAQVLCSRFLKWYVQHYPPVFDEIAAAMGMGPLFVMKTLKDLMTATRWQWDDKKKKRVPTNEPHYAARASGVSQFLKLVEKTEKWRRAFLEKDKAKPTEIPTVPQFETVQEFEEWARQNNPLEGIEADRKAATEARDRRLAEEGRMPMAPPPLSGGIAHNGR